MSDGSITNALKHIGALLRTDDDQGLWLPLAHFALYDLCDRLTELGSLDEQILGLEGGLAPAGEEAAPRRGRPKGSKNKGRRVRRVKGQKSLKVWVQEELQKAKKGLTLDELIAAVQAAGYKSKSDKFKNVMYQCLFHGQRSSLYQRDAESKRWVLTGQ